MVSSGPVGLDEATFNKAAYSEVLVSTVVLVALRSWLAAPGSDVEKSLSKAMRSRHSELDQASRAEIAARVLGVAVFRGRLAHILEREIGPNAGGDASLLHALFVAQRQNGDFSRSTTTAVLPPECSLQMLANASSAPLFTPTEFPLPHDRLAAAWSLPVWLASRWVNELGACEAFRLGRAMTLPGRVTLRTNTLKTTRLDLLREVQEAGVRAIPTAESPWGVWLPDGRPPRGGVWQLPGWTDGLFEVQDEGSQIIALATEAQPGERVLDYCAGRGGKTWALASLVTSCGHVRAWDIDAELRQQLRGARAERAGANGIVHAPDERPLPPGVCGGDKVCGADVDESLTGPGVAGGYFNLEPPHAHSARNGIRHDLFDVVLVDAPCSSSGVLRRHPSQRWALDEADVSRISALQLQILEEAALLVRPGGRLVYATCSLFKQENANVADAFAAAHKPLGACAADGIDLSPVATSDVCTAACVQEAGVTADGCDCQERVVAKETNAEASTVNTGDVAIFEPWCFSDDELSAQNRILQEPANMRTLLPHVHGTDGFFMARWRRHK